MELSSEREPLCHAMFLLMQLLLETQPDRQAVDSQKLLLRRSLKHTGGLYLESRSCRFFRF